MGNSSSFRHSNPYYRIKMCIDIEQKIISNIIRLEPFTCTHCDPGGGCFSHSASCRNGILMRNTSPWDKGSSLQTICIHHQSKKTLFKIYRGFGMRIVTSNELYTPVMVSTNPRKLYSKYTGDLEWGSWLQTSCIHQWWLAPTQENSI